MGSIMTNSLMCLVVLAYLFHVTRSQQHFRGGCTSFDQQYEDGEYNGFTVTLLSGWDLEHSPCGDSDCFVGMDTTDTRKAVLGQNGENYFGDWRFDIKFESSSDVQEFLFTAEINEQIQGEVVYVSASEPFWMQEMASFDLLVANCEYIDIILYGSSWLDLQMPDCANCDFYISQRIICGNRSDTFRQNSSPVCLFSGINRIDANTVSTIPVSVADPDGDNYICLEATGELAPIPQIPGMTVGENTCMVTVDSTGFAEDSWGMVNILIRDLPTTDITMGGVNYTAGGSDYLSQVQVQFLVQVSAVQQPKIVEPTACFGYSGYETSLPTFYFSDDGEVVTIPLYAQPHPDAADDTKIASFRITCLPEAPTALDRQIEVTDLSSDGSWVADLLWNSPEPGAIEEDGLDQTYLLQVVARDSLGVDSDICSFQIQYQESDDSEDESGDSEDESEEDDSEDESEEDDSSECSLDTVNSTLDMDESCFTILEWETAFREQRVTCTCINTETCEPVPVIYPRVSTERLLRAFYFGIGGGGAALSVVVITTIVMVKKSKQELERKRQRMRKKQPVRVPHARATQRRQIR